VKYFFLADGWTYARVWEFAGIWDTLTWRRKPEIQKLNLGIVEKGQILWLYCVEDAVLMLEVKPTVPATDIPTIRQVIVKRLISADQVLSLLNSTDRIFRNDEIFPTPS
jgi:hypothetical protein